MKYEAQSRRFNKVENLLEDDCNQDIHQMNRITWRTQ